VPNFPFALNRQRSCRRQAWYSQISAYFFRRYRYSYVAGLRAAAAASAVRKHMEDHNADVHIITQLD
jgi:hypothetical protein